MNRIAIVGPGAIGSLIGGLLARAGNRVFLLDDSEPRAAQRAAEGIRIVDGDSSWRTPVASSTCAGDFEISDAIFICTKTYQTHSALAVLGPLLGRDTILVSLQNGIGNAEHLANVTPDHCLCGTTAMGALLDAANSVHWTGHGNTQLAPFGTTSTADAETIARLLTAADCECRVELDAASMLWGKLIINSAINPVTALYGITNGELLENSEAREQAFAAALEAKTVTDARGIKLPYDDVIAAITDVCLRTAANRSSMLRDIECGRPTEIDAITGAIINAARTRNIPTPVNDEIFTAVELASARERPARM